MNASAQPGGAREEIYEISETFCVEAKEGVRTMNVMISVRGLVPVVLLLVSIAFLWATIATYLQIDPRTLALVMSTPVTNNLTKAFGTAFIISISIFAVLFYTSIYQMSEQHGQKEESVKHE